MPNQLKGACGAGVVWAVAAMQAKERTDSPNFNMVFFTWYLIATELGPKKHWRILALIGI